MTETTNFDAVEEIGVKLTSLASELEMLSKSLESDGAAGFAGYILPRDINGPEEAPFYPEYHPWSSEVPNPHAGAGQAYQQITFIDGQDSKETLRFPGIIAASKETVAIALRVNKLKDDFQKYIISLKKDDDSPLVKLAEKKRDSVIAQALNPGGHGRICLKQLYRPICIAKGEVLWARFFLDPRQSVRPQEPRTIINEANRLYEETNDTAYDFIARCVEEAVEAAKRENRNVYFAKVGSSSDIICANLKFVDKPSDRAKKHTAVMPVIYNGSADSELSVTTGSLLPRTATNAHTKIMNEPFAKLMRIHQYLPGVTPSVRKKK